MTHLRIEHVDGAIRVITESGEEIPVDSVTISLQAGAKTRILVENKKEGKRVRMAGKFFANVRD